MERVMKDETRGGRTSAEGSKKDYPLEKVKADVYQAKGGGHLMIIRHGEARGEVYEPPPAAYVELPPRPKMNLPPGWCLRAVDMGGGKIVYKLVQCGSP
jgi:hypothetical protein